MPLDQHPTPTQPETTICQLARSATLHAVFIADGRTSYFGLLTGASCELPTGEAVQVHHKRTPFFSLCRELDARGYGDCRIEISTPQGTPSMRAVVRVAAGLTVTERDQDGLRLEKYRPFPSRGLPQERDLGSEGTQTPENEETRLSESITRVEAA